MRTLWWAALVAGGSYCLAAWLGWTGPAVVAWKGAGVALLAAWAASRARNLDGWLLAMVLALGALGDVMLDAAGMIAGAAAFLAGHLVAIALYLRNRRPVLGPSQRALGWLAAPAIVVIAVGLAPSEDVWTVGLYAVALGVMAATAWTSRFPRYRTGIGAMLFVASDLLIFAGAGPLTGSVLPGLLIWPLYFAGQALIAAGVAGTLNGRGHPTSR